MSEKRLLPARNRRPASLRRPLAVLVSALFGGGLALANPVNPTVVSGSATFATTGSKLTVSNTPGAIINWQQFNIGAGETTHFDQLNASSQVLNRITGGNPSEILGTLSSNGRVYLINPNGIAFGAGSQVNVAGLVASTLNLSDADFLAGRLNFQAQPGAGKVINQGSIETANGGQVVLVASNVENAGVIKAPNGDVVLAAGKTVSLVDPRKPEIAVEITAAQNQAVNLGQILSRNVSLLAGVVRNAGTVQADSAVIGEGGRIFLKAADVSQEGTLKAGGSTGGEVVIETGRRFIQSQGGEIDASGAQGGRVSIVSGQGADDGAFVSGRISADGSAGAGGDIVVSGAGLYFGGAAITADGRSDGGQVRLGGDAHGANPLIANAQSNYVNTSSRISASGAAGHGGRVIVWSEGQTTFGGDIRATGASRELGGFVEVSGRDRLHYAGTVAARELLLDPKNIVVAASGSLSSFQLVDPDPGASNGFADKMVQLANGNVVVTSSGDSFGGATNAGAVYLFNSTTGALIGTVRGSQAGDQIGSSSVVALANSNYVLASQHWQNGAAANAGAVTLVSGTSGLTVTGGGGNVTAANSLVGSQANDNVGRDVLQRARGLNVASSPITTLGNGDYVVSSPDWANGGTAKVGAVTLVSGATGLAKANGSGTISAANSLIGSQANDQVGAWGSTALSSGNYAVASPYWSNGGTSQVGAVTLASGSTGQAVAGGGVVSAANSLVGSQASDHVGSGNVYALANGNYVVDSVDWANGGVSQAGAVTLVNGTTGLAFVDGSGVVSTANSLYGSQAVDQVGERGVTLLANGNYVVNTPYWSNGAASQAGAVTLVSGATGLALADGSGLVSAANSLTASAPSGIGTNGVVALSNGNYVVGSMNWANGAANGAGAVTLVNGTTGRALIDNTFLVSAANSLVGTQTNDNVGSGQGVTALSNGNYVVRSPFWNNGAATRVGAVTLVSGTTGRAVADNGLVVSAGNSLLGSQANDWVGWGGVTVLSNGNYVVNSPKWAYGGLAASGAVTLVNGTTGRAVADNSFVVAAANSLVGDWAAGGQLGYYGVIGLANGNYVVGSPKFSGVTPVGLGGYTLVNGLTGRAMADNGGLVNSSNTLSEAGMQSTFGTTTLALSNGNFAFALWDNVGSAGKVNVLSGSGYSPSLFSDTPGGTQTLSPGMLTATLNLGTSVTLQANNDITVNAAITTTAGGSGGNLTLQAGRSIDINADITTDNGSLTLSANDPNALPAYRDAGVGNITMGVGTTINTGSGGLNATLNGQPGEITLRSVSAGSLVSSGITHQLGSASFTTLNFSGGDFDLGNGVTLAVSGAADISAGKMLTLGSGASLNAGSMNVQGSLSLSGGSLTAGATTVASGGTLDLASGTASFGSTLNIQSGGTVNYSLGGATTVSGLTSNAGTFNINGSNLNLAGGLTQTAGLTQLGSSYAAPGSFTVGGAGFLLNGGTLQGSGTLTGNLSVGTATLNAGHSPGMLTISGNLTLAAASNTIIELGGTTPGAGYDVINVGGLASLDGTLNVVPYGGYTPQAGFSYDFLNFGSTSGSFATVNIPPAWNMALNSFSSYLSLLSSAPSLPLPGGPVDSAVQQDVLVSIERSGAVSEDLVPTPAGARDSGPLAYAQDEPVRYEQGKSGSGSSTSSNADCH